MLLHGALASTAHLPGEFEPLARRFVHAVDVVGQSVKSADARDEGPRGVTREASGPSSSLRAEPAQK